MFYESRYTNGPAQLRRVTRRKPSRENLSRRSFLRASVGAVSVLALAACDGSAPSEPAAASQVPAATPTAARLTPIPTASPRPTPPRTAAPASRPTPTASPTPTLSPSPSPTATAIATPTATPELVKTPVTAGLISLPAAAEPWSGALAGLAERHPEIEVTPIPFSGGQALADWLENSAEPLPDVLVGAAGADVARLAASEALAPLDQSIADPSEFVAEALAPGRYGGALLGLPISGYAVHLYVNPVVVEQAGVTLAGPTYLDLLDDARRLTDPETGRFGWGVVPDLPELETVAGSASGGVWSEDGSSTRIDSQAFVAAWQWFADLAHKEHVSPHPGAWDSIFGMPAAVLSGRIAMTLQSGWALGGVSPEKSLPGAWAIAALPAWEGVARHVPFNAAYASVTRTAGNPEAAAQVARYFATEGVDPQFQDGIPAWRPALQTAATTLGMHPAVLTEALGAWRRPALDVPHAAAAAAEVYPALRAVVEQGQPAADHAPRLAARLAEIARQE